MVLSGEGCAGLLLADEELGGAGTEEAEAGREAVDEIPAADRADLAVAEKSGNRQPAQRGLDGADIVMRLAV